MHGLQWQNQSGEGDAHSRSWVLLDWISLARLNGMLGLAKEAAQARLSALSIPRRRRRVAAAARKLAKHGRG